MIPVLIIIIGVILAFFGSIKLLRFVDEFSKRIEEINSLYESDAFKAHSDMRKELDELNFSYYEILDRQDERISHIETSLSNLVIEKNDSEHIEKSLDVQPKFDSMENEFEENSTQELYNIADQNTKIDYNSINKKLNEQELIKNKILTLYKGGKNVNEIAKLLEIGVGTVDLVCSLYAKQEREI